MSHMRLDSPTFCARLKDAARRQLSTERNNSSAVVKAPLLRLRVETLAAQLSKRDMDNKIEKLATKMGK